MMQIGWRCLVGGWGIAAIACVVWGLRYGATPGADRCAPALLTSSLSDVLRPGPAGCAAIVLHPRCPCSKASVVEFAAAVERMPGDVRIVVLAVTPAEAAAPADWLETASLSEARKIPGVHLVEDRGGVIAARLGASTSGHVSAYDSEGHLIFSGGTTGARGMTGANPARDALVAAFARTRPDSAAPRMPVFGCALIDPAPENRAP